MKAVIEEYDQKMNEIKNPPFTKAQEAAQKNEEGQVASSATTAGDITLTASAQQSRAEKKDDVSKSEEARSLYSDADLNEVVDQA